MKKYENLSEEQVLEIFEVLLALVVKYKTKSRYDVFLPSGLSGLVTFKKGICSLTMNLPVRRQLTVWQLLLEKFNSRYDDKRHKDAPPIKDDEQAKLAIEEIIREIRGIKPSGGTFAIPLINPKYYVNFNQTSSDVWSNPSIHEQLQLLNAVWEQVKPNENNEDQKSSSN